MIKPILKTSWTADADIIFDEWDRNMILYNKESKSDPWITWGSGLLTWFAAWQHQPIQHFPIASYILASFVCKYLWIRPDTMDPFQDYIVQPKQKKTKIDVYFVLKGHAVVQNLDTQ